MMKFSRLLLLLAQVNYCQHLMEPLLYLLEVYPMAGLWNNGSRMVTYGGNKTNLKQGLTYH